MDDEYMALIRDVRTLLVEVEGLMNSGKLEEARGKLQEARDILEELEA